MEFRSTFLKISLTGDLKKEATSLENFSSCIFIYRLPVMPAMTQIIQAGNDAYVIPDLIGDLYRNISSRVMEPAVFSSRYFTMTGQ